METCNPSLSDMMIWMFAVSLLSYWRNLTPRKQRVKTGYKTNPYTSHNFPLHPFFRDSPDTKEIVENCGAGGSRSRMQTINETFESQDPMRRKNECNDQIWEKQVFPGFQGLVFLEIVGKRLNGGTN